MFGLFGGGDKSGDKPEESLEKEWDMTGDSFGSSDAQLNDPYSSMEDPFADSADSFDDSTEHFVSAAGGVSDIYQDLHEPAQTTIRDTSEQRSTSSNQDDGPVDMSALFGINSNVLNAVNAQQSGEQDRFLSSKRKGLWETGMHNVGTTYLSGMVIGGAFGVFEGAAKAPKRRARGKRGSSVGNAIGTLALLYTATEYGLDQVGFDTVPDKLGLPRKEIYTQMTAAATAAALYRLPQMVIRRSATGVAIVGASALLAAGAVAGLGIVGSTVDPNNNLLPFSWDN